MGNKSTDYKRQFNAEKYDRIYLTVPKGQKEMLKEFAKNQIVPEYPNGESLNEFIIIAINERIERLELDLLFRSK